MRRLSILVAGLAALAGAEAARAAAPKNAGPAPTREVVAALPGSDWLTGDEVESGVKRRSSRPAPARVREPEPGSETENSPPA